MCTPVLRSTPREGAAWPSASFTVSGHTASAKPCCFTNASDTKLPVAPQSMRITAGFGGFEPTAPENLIRTPEGVEGEGVREATEDWGVAAGSLGTALGAAGVAL